MPLSISAADLVDDSTTNLLDEPSPNLVNDSTTNLVDEPNIYQTRWPKVLGVLQIVLGMAALGVNIPLRDTKVGTEWAGLWCGLGFIIVAGVVQIISARNQVKSWIAISIMVSILAATFGIVVIVFSAKGVRYEYYTYAFHGGWERPRTAHVTKSLFGVIGLIGVVEMGIAITSALLGCKALNCCCSCMCCPLSSKISEFVKRFVDKEKINSLRAVRLGKMHIVLGLLAITFNAAGIGVAAKNAMEVSQGFWCGMFFILAGCCLYMSDKARIWILMCLPTLVIAGALTIPLLVYGVIGLITPIQDFLHRWFQYDQVPEMKIIARVCHTGLIIVAVSEFVVAILSLRQVVKCFRWDGNFKDSSKRTVEASMTELTTTVTELTTTVKELTQELITVREELKQAHSAPGRTDQTVNETPTDKGMDLA